MVRNNPVMAAQYGHLILQATPPARASNNAPFQQASLADKTLATTAWPVAAHENACYLQLPHMCY